ncbi:hypothetical protein J1N35_042806 [Gossypium stocksii]|uniref:Uncharacterized protein n=1 Tax=Gossypium stocksii TaxID=47602 RepID=A0A9D3U690_9ROSI|nr:hypothetical protein J1N35_042806 [Gossypium stocksii]
MVKRVTTDPNFDLGTVTIEANLGVILDAESQPVDVVPIPLGTKTRTPGQLSAFEQRMLQHVDDETASQEQAI